MLQLAEWRQLTFACLGGEEFHQELLEQVDARPGPSHFGEAVQEAEAAQAERLVVEGLKLYGTVIFIRTCKHIDGSTDVPKVTNARVPAPSL